MRSVTALLLVVVVFLRLFTVSICVLVNRNSIDRSLAMGWKV